ncbi:unnamed protein product [Symbiodinium natans]|uniref:C3H1-type domain-containing protein n=1 Tax=Symbiodinium natans TaxID=878477 RepID=A0A812NTP9_9DINO|nr:unnamed protein product [Symbiodinium natans]
MAAMTLEYLNTFIHVKEDTEEMEKGGKVRCHSSPPGSTRLLSFTMETAQEEDAMRSYVAALAERAANLAQPAQQQRDVSLAVSNNSAELEDVSPSPPVAQELRLSSSGSLGHPEACRRPCVYLILGHCASGEACAYCHMMHTGKWPKLDKKQRIMMQQCNQAQLLTLLLPFCRARAERFGFAREAAEILRVIEENSSSSPLTESFPWRDLRNLRKTLARMSFSSLLDLVAHQSKAAQTSPGDDRHDLAARLVDLLNALRCQLTL